MDEAEAAALVRRCQTGDTEAFRALVETYKNTLFGVAYFMTHDRAAAEDAVQEGLVQIWCHIHSLRDPGRIKPWLIRIVVNEVNQQFRKKPAPSLPLEAADAAFDDNLPEEQAMTTERRRLICHALDGLPREQREAVILRFYSDLSVPEIAAVTHSPEGTIKSRLHRAMSYLSTILQAEGLEVEV